MLLVIGFAVAAAAADDYKKHPGYVDFEKMGIFGESEAAVEVILKGSLLKMILGGIDDPELADMVGKLQYVHVQSFPVDEMDIPALERKIQKTAKQLEDSGWDVVVRVRDNDEDEQVYVYILPTKSDEIISGLVVMVVEQDDKAVFINVVGDLDPAQIGKLGHTFDIDELDDIHMK